MADVTKLPAETCRFHLKGKCLYEERLNPGYERQWRCLVMTRWEEIFDEFLRRAEAFGIEYDRVLQLWEARFQRLIDADPECEEFELEGAVTPPCCAHEYDALCLLELPLCDGRCRHFLLHDEISTNPDR